MMIWNNWVGILSFDIKENRRFEMVFGNFKQRMKRAIEEDLACFDWERFRNLGESVDRKGLLIESKAERYAMSKIDKFIKSKYSRAIKNASPYLKDDLDNAIDIWVDTLVQVVRDSERRGDGDITELDYYNRAGDVAEVLGDMDAKGTVKGITYILNDLEVEIADEIAGMV